VLRETDPQAGLTLWEALLPEQARRLPAELAKIDTYLDDERFIAPWRALFDRRLGRPSVPVDTLLRLLYLKHRYQLGYESLCREVADSIGWRRFCRLGLDQPVPHPTTLVKLVRRAGPEVIEQLNQALVAKLAADKLLRARKLRVDTTVVEADIDYPTDADLLEQAVRKLGGLVRRIKGRGAASRTRFRNRGRAAGRRMKQLARTLRRRTGVAMAEVDRLTGEVAGIARQSLREVQAVARNARSGLARRPGDGRLGRLVGELEETIAATGRLLSQTDQRLAGNRVIPDRLVSLSDPDARPIRKGKPRTPTQFGDPLLLAEDERGLSPTISSTRATRPTLPSSCPPSSGSSASPAGHRIPWSVTAGSAPPPTTRPWKRWASSGSGCSATAPRAGRGWRWSGPGGSGGCATGGSASRPASATSNAHSGYGVPGYGGWAAPAPGRAGDLCLQPAAHDRGRQLTDTPAIDPRGQHNIRPRPTGTSSGASS
jgi:transposase, IS5 family